MEAYSKHPIVKKANAPGEVMGVGEFLSLVRRMVVDFVVGQVLTGNSEDSDMAAADRMDATTPIICSIDTTSPRRGSGRGMYSLR